MHNAAEHRRAVTWRLLCRLAGLAVALLGAAVLAGWMWHIQVLKSVLPGLASMKANSALGMILSGGALTLLSRRTLGKTVRYGVAATAIIVIAMGGLSLSEDLFNRDFGIDQLMFRDRGISVDTAQPERMSPATAFCFFLIGGALAVGTISTSKNRRPLLMALSSAVAAVGVLALVGYVSDAVFNFNWWNYTGMAVHTALGFMLLGGGVIALVRSEERWHWSLDRRATTGFVAGILLMLVAAGMAFNSTNEMNKAAGWVNHTHEVLKEIREITTSMASLESSQGGYLITGDEHLLAGREEAERVMRDHLEIVSRLTSDNPQQQVVLNQLKPLALQRTAFGDKTIVVGRAQGLSAGRQLVASGVGINLQKEIERLHGQVVDEEELLLHHRENRLRDISTTTFLLLPIGVFLSLTTLSVGLFFLDGGITDKMRAEEALFKAGALQRAIFSSANFSCIATDANGVIQLFNVGAEHMLGYTAAEVINKITPADISDPQEVIARAAALSLELGIPIAPGFEALVFKASRGIEDIYELTKVRKDGSRFPAVVSATALRDAQAAIIGYLLIGIDNTARKLTDDALRQSEAQLQTIVENISEAVVVSDLKGHLLHFNHAALDMLGYASGDEGRRDMNELADTFELSGMDGAKWPVNQWPLARILRGEKLHDVEGRMRRINTNGNQAYNFGGTLAHDASGKPLMAVVTFSDITERIETEGTIRRWNTELEERIADRTTELAETNKELEAFTYSVSHDLRSPLRAIDGFSRILETEHGADLPPEAKRFLGLVRSNVQQMGRLLEDLLALCRHGRQTMTLELLDPGAIAAQAWQDLTQWPDGRVMDFELEKLPPCQADPILLKQVFANLLSNAIKFTRGRERALIQVGSRQDEAGVATYFVKDNGIGFDMRYVEKLFGLFQRLHRAEDFEGTGVGMAIVQRIIQRHNGHVWAESEIDKGTTVFFTLGKEST